MRRAIVATIVSACALTGSVIVRGQRPAAFACAPDNGGLTLPAGFCAAVIADNLGSARTLVVASNGDIFMSFRAGLSAAGQPPTPGYILGLRDTNGDGKIDRQEKFGPES